VESGEKQFPRLAKPRQAATRHSNGFSVILKLESVLAGE
jgi:hypothetical protein